METFALAAVHRLDVRGHGAAASRSPSGWPCSRWRSRWRSVRLVRIRRGINAGLRATRTPSVRIAAVEQAAELGLGAPPPRPAARGARRRQDPAVLAAVVETRSPARQWEPASTGPHRRAAAVGRGATPDTPSRAAARGRPDAARRCCRAWPAPSTPPSLDPAPSAAVPHRGAGPWPSEDSVRTLASPCRAAARRPTPLPSGRPARAGHRRRAAPAGVAVIRACRRAATTWSPSTPTRTRSGCAWPTRRRSIPRSDDPHYLAALLRVATVTDRAGADLHRRRGVRRAVRRPDYLDEAGVRTLHAADRDRVELCVDKWAFAPAP